MKKGMPCAARRQDVRAIIWCAILAVNMAAASEIWRAYRAGPEVLLSLLPRVKGQNYTDAGIFKRPSSH